MEGIKIRLKSLNLKHCPLKCKRTAYLSLVRSVLEYGCTVWDPYLQKDIDQLERVQRKAIRFITGDYKSMTPGTIYLEVDKQNTDQVNQNHENGATSKPRLKVCMSEF